MIEVLRTDLKFYFLDNDIEILIEKTLSEYMFYNRKYDDFSYHTHRHTYEIDADSIREKEIKKTDYLKSKFIDNLKNGEKIFVRKGMEKIEDIFTLWHTLQTNGKNGLLWVVEATEDRQIGTAELISERLYKGYIRRFKAFDKDEPVEFENWLAICEAIYKFHRSHYFKEFYCLPESKVIASGNAWSIGPACRSDTASDIPLSDRANGAKRLTLLYDTEPTEVLASHALKTPIRPRSIIVFAVWVWVSDSFGGYRIDACLPALSVLHSQKADLSKRNEWQKIWVSAKVPRDVTEAVGEVRSGGAKNSVIYVSSWTFEDGVAPQRDRPAFSLRHPGLKQRLIDHLIKRVKVGGFGWRLLLRHTNHLIEKGQFEAADTILMKALDIHPEQPDLLKLFALSAHNDARYATAIGRWTAALNADPDDSFCAAGLAANLRGHGALDRAADVIGQTLRRFPDDMIVVTEAARIAQKCEHYTEALRLWDQAAALPNPHPEWIAGQEACRSAIPRQS